MADLTITPANVLPGAGTINRYIAGEVIDAGEAICNIDGTAYLSDANHATAARNRCDGIATTDALVIGQPVYAQKTGPITFGGTGVVKGLPYFVSATPGKLCPVADLPGGSRACLAGYGLTTSTFQVQPEASGITLAARVDIATVTPGNGVDTNEVQSITIRYATGGTFTLTFEGQTTAAIAYDANAAAIESALEALSNLTAVAVTGSGTEASPFLVTFEDDFSDQDQMTATITSLLPV